MRIYCLKILETPPAGHSVQIHPKKVPQTKTFLRSFSNNDNIKYYKTREGSLIMIRISRPPGVTAFHNLCKTTFVCLLNINVI